MLLAGNPEVIQATIETFVALICIVMAIMLALVTRNKRVSEKALTGLIIVVVLSLIADEGWYIIDGDLRPVAIVLNRVFNFLQFITNPLELFFATLYMYKLIEENGGKVKKGLIYASYAIEAILTIMPLTNIFVPWMYSFDILNVYHRQFGWYIFSGICSFVIVLSLIFIIIYRKEYTKKKKISLIIFMVSPFVGILLQMVSSHISFVMFATAISVLIMGYSYVDEWIQGEDNRNNISEDKKRFWVIEAIFLIMVLCISASVISCIVSIKLVSDSNSKQNSTSLARMVSETVEVILDKPIDVSKTMAETDVIRNAVVKDDIRETKTEAEMLAFMERIKDAYGFERVFVVSDKTLAYYKSVGLSQYIEPDTDPEDIWYKEFKESSEDYSMYVCFAGMDSEESAVYVDKKIYDDNGEFVGVCGVGMSLNELMDILEKYEKEYDLDIELTNYNGIIEIDTKTQNIGKESQYNYYFERIPANELYYEKDSLKAVLTKYIKEYDWYLVVQDNNPDKINIFTIILPCLMVYIAGLVIMIVFIMIFGNHEKRKNAEIYKNKRLSETDALTGALNRNAFENYSEYIQQNGMSNNLAVIMMDVNGLKTVNDNIGHNAGDELIIGAAGVISKAFSAKGDVYRTGGDEFIVITEASEADLNMCISSFEKLMSEWKGCFVKELTISYGVAEHSKYPSLSLDELVKEADKLMYKSKEEYYIRTGKKRRT